MCASSLIALFYGRMSQTTPPVLYYPPFSRRYPTVKNQIKSFLLRICYFSPPRALILRATRISMLYKRQAGSSASLRRTKLITAVLG